MSSATSEIDIEALKRNLHERLETHKAPFHGVDHHAAAGAIDALQSNEPAHWAETWSRAALPFEEAAQHCEAAGDRAGARDAYLNAYGLLHAGRFPSPTHPAKWDCYLRSVRNFRAAGASFDPPLEVITIPFAGRAGEGRQITFYVRRRGGGAKQPVMIRWGGVDTWKEERTDYNEAMLAAGFASINIDMPGVGESPVLGSIDAERQYGPLFDWIRTQPDLDAARVVVIGMSYGGYWATKIAHTYPDRIVAAVNWGGGIDRFFTREWCLRSASAPSYLMDLSLTRARTVGATTYDEYIERVRDFSLVAQGVLDRPHAPMLIVNGRNDVQVPFDDMLVLLEHGAPKTARFFPGGHMGYGPDTFPTVLAWVKAKAGSRAVSVYTLQKMLREVNRSPGSRERYFAEKEAFVSGYALTADERSAVLAFDVRKLYALGVHGLILRPFTIIHKMSEPDYLRAIRGEA